MDLMPSKISIVENRMAKVWLLAKNLMNGYNEVRKITKDEKNAIKVLSQGAALRFLLTRVFDYINTVDDAVVKIKDPEEYLKRLEFHKNAKSFEDYLI